MNMNFAIVVPNLHCEMNSLKYQECANVLIVFLISYLQPQIQIFQQRQFVRL